ncbi:FMN-binding negative transcriptional regulator [Nocardioides cavernaquae]|uniref:FMN-binding negative transcriptional regulator n=1 Tax=Nocardioides cavernaquae TaxID=2321396 RepID=A0A3A5HAG9_9ACTN|nr:FMN-binding negative transcriptional regulator [Nocardioides cavernaquae]RJS47629.1 FMN-binding negative transcriptional regulator [Nocardioides cavernaquae]
MYVPPFNRMPDAELRSLVASVGSAELITVGSDGFPQASRLPVIWSGERLIFHLAIANPHWRSIVDGAPALAIVTGPEAYISPSWYAAKAEHGRVVPTWNYDAIHFTGRVTVRREPEWLLAAVTELTDLHEGVREEPWAVSDAPETYVAQMLKAIVGIDFEITGIEAKAKRSQNRSDHDRAGVVAGLRAEPSRGNATMADQMESDLNP